MAGFDNEDIFGSRLRVADGTASLPSMTFTNDPNTGFYSISADVFGATAGGALALRISGTSTQFLDGSAATPSIALINDPDTGLFSSSANILGVAAGGLLALQIGNASTSFPDGTAASPSIRFINDTNTGLYRIGSDQLGFATGGVIAGSTNGSQWFFKDGTSSIPSISFVSDTDTGFYRSASNTFHAMTGGTARLTWDDAGRTRILQGFVTAVTKTATDYVVLNTDYYVGVTSTAAARNITLTSANFVSGQEFVIKDESMAAGTNNITLTPTTGNIDNAATAVINVNGGSIKVKFDGTNYWII